MAGMDRDGLVIKRLLEVIDGFKESAIPIFQDLVPPGDIVDTSDSSTIGRLIGLVSPSISDLWEAVQDVYLAFDPNSATGVALDNLVAIGGVIRLFESKSRADLYLVGDREYTLPRGSLIRSTSTQDTFETLLDIDFNNDVCHGVGFEISLLEPNEDYKIFYKGTDSSVYSEVTISTGGSPTTEGLTTDIVQALNQTSGLESWEEDGVIYVQSDIELHLLSFYTSFNLNITRVIAHGVAQAQESGPIEAFPNTLTQIATPHLGWWSVTNPISANVGRARETDEQLRNRFRATKFQRATNIIESLYSALFSLDGVINVIIYENDTSVVDYNGLPPHSFWVIIDGGVDSEIAQAIWNNRPTGILSVGNEDVSIVDSFGYIRSIKFDRPTDKDIYIRMTLTPDNRFPLDGDDRIKEYLKDYVDSLSIGEDLVFSRLYTPINKVVGHQVDVLEVSDNNSDWASANISVAVHEKLRLDVSNIQIT